MSLHFLTMFRPYKATHSLKTLESVFLQDAIMLCPSSIQFSIFFATSEETLESASWNVRNSHYASLKLCCARLIFQTYSLSFVSFILYQLIVFPLLLMISTNLKKLHDLKTLFLVRDQRSLGVCYLVAQRSQKTATRKNT